MPDSHLLKRPPMVTACSSSSSLGLRPQGPLTRPSYSHSGSSSSSLSGMEQSVQPFQDFIKQTRAIDAEKPLPPPPLASNYLFDLQQYPKDGHHEAFDSGRHAEDRRSSSVYSRTQSQWIPNSQSVENLDTVYNSYLWTNSYGTDIPGVNIRQPTSDYSETRHCSPLIGSPSPTLSDVSTVSRSRPPTLKLSNPVQERPKARLMSLEKANRTFNAPGKVHLLPEELRAQSSKKSKARKHNRMESGNMVNMFSSPRPPPLPPAAFIHEEKRLQSTSTGASVSPHTKSSQDAIQQSSGVGHLTLMKTFRVGTGPAREMLPPLLPDPPRLSDNEERGRTRESGHTNREDSTRRPIFMHDLNPRPIPEQCGLSSMQTSESGSYTSAEDDVRGHMKMIPQPLFQPKSPIQHRKEARDVKITSPLGHSALRIQQNRQESASSGRSTGFPLPLSLTPPPGGIRHRQSKSSTTGMIPISPPSGGDHGQYHIPPPIDTSQNAFQKSILRHEAKISSLYPRLVSRNKNKKAKADVKLVPKWPSIGAPLLPPDVVAAVLLTPDTTPQTSPLASNSVVDGLERSSSGLSAEGKRPLFQRFKGMTMHVRRDSKQHNTSLEESPTQTSRITHLGWTETAKATWDQARVTATNMRRKASHASSSDESGAEEVDLYGPAVSRPTLFGPFVESYRETRAQKRREDLKKTIKIVAPLDEPFEAGESDGESEMDGVFRKRLSGYNWM